jgi:hypothetical protein
MNGDVKIGVVGPNSCVDVGRAIYVAWGWFGGMRRS